MIIYHESPAHNFRGAIERHFRDVVRNALILYGTGLTPGDVFREACKTSCGRWSAFKRHAHKFGFTPAQRLRARWLCRYYGALDVLCALVVCCKPSLLKRWLRYQFGDLAHGTPVVCDPPVLGQSVHMSGV